MKKEAQLYSRNGDKNDFFSTSTVSGFRPLVSAFRLHPSAFL
jgi:hypothetical protein